MSSNCFDQKEITAQIKAEALRLGFSVCGVAKAEPVGEQEQSLLKEWLALGRQGEMSYLENHFDKRCDPQLLLEGTKSIISVALNYHPAQQLQPDQYQFARYAYGKDYHDIVKERLTALLEKTKQLHPAAAGRPYCDTAPILERYWAWKAGLGWIGKNTLLIIPRAGSYFLLGELFLNIELDYDSPQQSRCGSCTRCLTGCPTQALTAPYQLDSRCCLSYLTIESRSELPEFAKEKLNNRIYGCDECQQACPWNRFAQPTSLTELQPSEALLRMTREQWHALTQEQYRRLFKGSAVKRAKFEGLKRNIEALVL
jgi:epoxyqueuosine reductase